MCNDLKNYRAKKIGVKFTEKLFEYSRLIRWNLLKTDGVKNVYEHKLSLERVKSVT